MMVLAPKHLSTQATTVSRMQEIKSGEEPPKTNRYPHRDSSYAATH